MRRRKRAIWTGAILFLGAVPAAPALDFETGDWDLSINGNVNAHYVFVNCDSSPAPVVGAVACVQHVDSGEESFTNIRTGMLPAAIALTVATQERGWDIAGTLGFYPGIASNDGGSPNLGNTPGGATNVALATTGIDVRQAFLEFGKAGFGVVKAGRDYGLFGRDVYLNDMSMPAVGAGTNAVGSPANTTLGSIGLGYIYPDTLAQVNYSAPLAEDLEITVGMFQTIDSLTTATSLGVAESAPGFHGRARYRWDSGFVSFNLLNMDVNCVVDPPGTFEGECVRGDSSGFDLTLRQAFGPMTLLFYYYKADGLGTTALLFNAFSANGEERKSAGGLLQVTYDAGATAYGFQYGESNLDRNSGDPRSLVDKNGKITVGLYHDLTPSLTLSAEFSYVTSESHAGTELQADNFNLGAQLSF